MEPELYVRRLFTVQAVQITDENVDEVARWVNPNFRALSLPDGKKRVMVPFRDAKGRPQKASAHVGNWVTKSVDGRLKVYSDNDFRNIFEREERENQSKEVLAGFGFDEFMQNQIVSALRQKGVI